MPEGTISIDSYGASYHKNVTQVGERLYDLTDNTFAFTGDLRVEYVLRYEFDCIPDAIGRYIALSAAARFNIEVNQQTSGNERDRKQQYIERDLREAKLDANRFETETSDVDVLSTYGAMRIRGVGPYTLGHGHNLNG